jgi:hypothetical protein
MRSVFGIVLAALSMVGLAYQNKVVTPLTFAATFPKVTLLLFAAPGVMIAPAAKPSKPVATISRPVADGIVLCTSTIDGVVTQTQLQAATEQTRRQARSTR